MKPVSFVAGIVALVAMSPELAATAQAVALTRQERAQMKAYVAKEKIRPANLDEKVSVGSTIPGVVLLRPPPASWPSKVARFQYIYHDNHIVLVDPGTRRVVQIVD
jgi:hypothetical protein